MKAKEFREALEETEPNLALFPPSACEQKKAEFEFPLAQAAWSLPLIVIGLALFSVSCRVGPNYTTPGAKVASQWEQTPAVTNRAYGAAEELWWRTFDDPVLNQLIERAFQNNLSLQGMGVRISEARARLNKSVGDLFPQQQGVVGQLNYSRLNDGVVTKIPGINRDYFSDQLLFAASWEIDFWGKYRRAIESDRAAFLGTIAAYDDALTTLLADVASSYVNIRTLEERLRVAERNLQIEKESLRIANAQWRGGATSERDVQQAKAQFSQTEAHIPMLEQSMSQNRNALAVLIGETPEELARHLSGPSRIPAAPPSVAAGIPKDLLRRRPDVRAAGLAAASKSALIGVARANMYPAFSLTGEFGVSGNNEGGNSLADMFSWENRVMNAGAGLFFPIFNYGRLINQVRVQDAQFQEAVLNYQNTVLLAQQEVANGLAVFSSQQRAEVLLSQAAAAARRSAELATIQYQGGQTDYTTVLTAQQAQMAIEDSLASTQGNVVLGIISVYRALGGGWQIRQGREVLSEEVKREMDRRTDWGRLLEPSGYMPHRLASGDSAQIKRGE